MLNKEQMDTIYRDIDYQILTDDDNNQYIRYYNSKTKFWVSVHYETEGLDGITKFKNRLKEIAIKECKYHG